MRALLGWTWQIADVQDRQTHMYLSIAPATTTNGRFVGPS